MVERIGIEFHLGGVSNHSPTVISFGKLRCFGPKPFKFYGFYCEHANFLSWVVEGWQIEVAGSPMFILYAKTAKLKVVKKILYAKNLEVLEGSRRGLL